MDALPRLRRVDPVDVAAGRAGIGPARRSAQTALPARRRRHACEAIRATLAHERATLRVGLSWSRQSAAGQQPSPVVPTGSARAAVARDDVAWYSLQRDDGEEQIASVPEASSLRLLDERNDFDGKAALWSRSISWSACARRRAPRRRPRPAAWVMLDARPGLALGNDLATSAWYPKARLFRQPARRRLGSRSCATSAPRSTAAMAGTMTVIAGARAPRNDPCPCGSGRRFKQCHGAFAAEAPPHGDLDVDPRGHRGRIVPSASRTPSGRTGGARKRPGIVRMPSTTSACSRCSGGDYEQAIPPLERSVERAPGRAGVPWQPRPRVRAGSIASTTAIGGAPPVAGARGPSPGHVEQSRTRAASKLAHVRRGDRRVSTRARDRSGVAKARWHLATARLARRSRRLGRTTRHASTSWKPGTAPDAPGVPRYRGGDLRGTIAARRRRAGLRRHVAVRHGSRKRSPSAARA